LIKNRQNQIDGFLDVGYTGLRGMAMFCLGAQQHSSVQQNEGQPLAPIETALAEYQAMCDGARAIYL
jgi:hypothetical protein